MDRNGRGAHRVVLDQHRLDFRELDAKAANLDLAVEASEVLQRPVPSDAHLIARPE